ncbi:hypothetical protein GFY24_31910 [Nocardia sp. SYP-A9097]|uniref:hypothetical protein n=1 Tax=Nocardia sp. SYP-A9097 TaxID=2663237 RepID=UPI00129A7C14|nr:hypothetical protein [Nocardia sp. SYP-A9097]MRH91991.1 hypothetical protein [Nocardia sp. SYP-A9097]
MTDTVTRRGRDRAVRVGRVAVAAVALVGLPWFGIHRFHQWQDRSVESVRIAGEVTVAGFERVAVVTWSPGDDLPEGSAYFAGQQPDPDPVAAVTVPSISLRPVDRVQQKSDRSIQVASGSRPDRCSASVYFNPDLTMYMGNYPAVSAKLTAARSAGKLLIQVHVRGCGV